jgi:hypothetical protein
MTQASPKHNTSKSKKFGKINSSSQDTSNIMHTRNKDPRSCINAFGKKKIARKKS